MKRGRRARKTPREKKKERGRERVVGREKEGR